jgi:hypothetical protein
MSDINFNALGNRGMPSPVGPGTQRVPTRSSRYGELVTQPLFDGKQYGTIDEGSYFFAQHPVIDAATTIAGHAAPVLADLYTKAFLQLRNTDANGSFKRVFLDYILITVITAGANGTSDNLAAECDAVTDRYSSGTKTALTIAQPNMQVANSSPVLVANAGPLVMTAASANQRKVGSGVFRPSIAIAGDEYLFNFGAAQHALGAAVATGVSRHIIPMPGIVLGPNDQFMLHLYAPSQSAAAVYKVMMGWWER